MARALKRAERSASWGVAFSCALWLVAGCTARVARPADPFVDGRELLLAHRDARVALQRLQAEARVDQRGKGGRIKGSVWMFVERPAKVRLDVMTQFGPIAIFTSDGREFAYSDLREQRYVSGPTCPDNVARLLGVALSAEETASILLGDTPLLGAGEPSVEWQSAGFYRVTLRASGGLRQEVDVEVWPEDRAQPRAAQRLRLLRSELFDRSGGSVWRLTYEDYQVVGGAAAGIEMAYRVRVEQQRQGNDTLIRFKELRLDAAVPEGAFSQQPRAGMKLEPAPCPQGQVSSPVDSSLPPAVTDGAE